VQLGARDALTPHRLSCTLYPSAQACRLKFSADEENALSASTRRQLAAQGFAHPVARLDDPAMIVRVFPVDPLLPGLAHALDAQDMLPLFAQHLEACAGRTPRGFRHEILHYKPRRSCIVHYEIDLGPDAGGAARSARVYGKVARDDRGERNHAVLRAAWQAARASGTWRAARPLAYLPAWRLLLQEAVPGRDFRLVFSELTPDDVTPAQLARARAHLGAIVAAVRSLQHAPLGAGPAKSFAHLLAEQEKNLQYLGDAEPRLAAEIGALRAELARVERTIPRAPLVFCHGDFAHGNVLIDGDTVGIIDFDKAGAAEPAFDVAYFLTHLWSFGLRHEKRMAHVAALWKHMRDEYLARAPEVSSERLAVYEALDFAAYVLRNFRKQSHQAGWLAWAQGQIEAARHRLDVAAGRVRLSPTAP
jgi:aminoglycoside phosphotransferase